MTNVTIQKKKTGAIQHKDVELGDYFLNTDNDEVFIVAQDDDNQYLLVCLNDGMNWTDARSEPEEMLSDGNFVKVKEVTITI